MKYHKSQITPFRKVTPATRGFNRKFLALLVDSLDVGYCITMTAYEADE